MTTYHNKKFILTLYTLLIVCMGFATIIGKMYGEGDAGSIVYGSWWFAGMWGLLVLASLVYLLQMKMHRRIALLMLHLSFAVILAGALVTHLTAESGTVHLREGEAVSSFDNDDGSIGRLPFSLTMAGFEINNYPGTDAVMDYQCSIDVRSKDATERMMVSINHIGKADGYRFYQSAYDSDLMGSQLLVAHDPYGISITYAGYALLLISLLWMLCSKHTRIKFLYHKATRSALSALLLFLLPVCADAQPKVTPVSKVIADDLGRVAVLYNGRICPLNTAATEFVTKLSGKGEWGGYSANEIFLGWMIYYTDWESQPIIKVKSAEVQRLLGIDGRWASVSDFYTPYHEYKLSDKANDTSLPASTRKAIREADERLQVVSMFYNSEMLHIFPLTVDGNTGWYTPGSTELPLGTPEAEFQFINHAMDQLTECVLSDDVPRAKQIIAKIRLYQREKASDVMPSSTTLHLETFYNTIHQNHWPAHLYLLLSLVFCIIMLTGHRTKAFECVHTAVICIALIWITLLLILRWWVSGHIPMSNGYETMLFMAWITLLVSVVTMRRLPILKALCPVASAFCMLVAMIAADSPQITNLMPVLQSPLLSIHVALVMISYALFAVITLISIYCFFLLYMQKYVALESMTALSILLLYPAVSLLALGIFIGAVWANISWGTYWSWDPKETWALITLMVYAIPLHRSFFPESPMKYHLYITVSFLAVLMTYFGVNYFLPGMHSYA